MMLCNHPDFDHKKARFDAYNRWIAEYCSAHPDRLIGVGQTAMRSVDRGIVDLREIEALGLRGVSMPSNPPRRAHVDDVASHISYRAAGYRASASRCGRRGPLTARGPQAPREPFDGPMVASHSSFLELPFGTPMIGWWEGNRRHRFRPFRPFLG